MAETKVVVSGQEVEIAFPPTAETPDPAAKDREALSGSRKPPADGPCKGCGQNKPLNRLMLCYPFWVKKRNEEKGWREGQPHPPGCGCDLECRFEKSGADN